MSELVEHVDEQDRVLGVVERGEALRQHWPHRIATTICRDRAGRILVLRRSETHSRFPGYYDVMVGGAGAMLKTCGSASGWTRRAHLPD